MTADHAHLEVLCALAASGQVTSLELAELHEHSKACRSCSDRLFEMAQVSAELFCAHAVNQPETRMPKDLLPRFIARANGEGIGLRPRTQGIFFRRPALAAAFLLALLVMSVILHLGFSSRSADETARENSASVPSSISDKEVVSQGSPGYATPGKEQASQTARRRKARYDGEKRPLLDSGANDHGRVPRFKSASFEQRRFDLTGYSRSIAVFYRPFFVAANLHQNIEWTAIQNRTARFRLAEASESAKDDPLPLLAEYEHQRFASWSPQDRLAVGSDGVQVLLRDFDPNANRTELGPDSKGFRPVFRFLPDVQQ